MRRWTRCFSSPISSRKTAGSLACVRCREYYEGLWRCGDPHALEKALVFGLDAVIRENLEDGNLILKDTLESRNAILYRLSVDGRG